MKQFMGLAVAAIIVLTSCQSELSFDDNSGNVGQLTGDFRATINGTQWVANTLSTGARMNGIINLTGRSNDGKTLTITLKDSGVHQYTLAQQTLSAAAYIDSASGNNISFTSNASDDPSLAGGSVNVTSIDTVNKRMSGTFSFRVFRPTDSTSVNITLGSFTNISYSTSLTPVNNTDTLYVTVDDTLYNATLVGGVAAFGRINITGTNSTNTQSLGISIPDTTTVGTYTLSSIINQTYYGGWNNTTSSETLESSVGSVTITLHNIATKRIRGTFNFTAVPFIGTTGPTRQLTAGFFAITYQ